MQDRENSQASFDFSGLRQSGNVTKPDVFEPPVNGVVYLASDLGILQAADAETGERLFQGRTGNLYTAAPIAGDGKVYFVSETGETVVLKASRDFEILARNQLEGRFLASPVIAKGLLLLRSDDEVIAVRE